MINNLIVGPCQHENFEHSFQLAKTIQWKLADKCNNLVFKASFDKANRSSLGGKRGAGLETFIKDFDTIRNMWKDMQYLTDVHTVEQVEELRKAKVVDIIQIPAFLCRQTDLVVAAVESGMKVNIKKGQFLAPWDMQGILTKCGVKKDQVWVTERGTSFGYNTLVNDFTGINWMLDNLPNPIVMDATHSVQKPGGLGGSSGGNREYVPGISRAAAGLGVRNFFLEVHDDPDNAPSDGPNMVHIDDIENVIDDINKIIEVMDNDRR